jgi:hypothetical protein
MQFTNGEGMGGKVVVEGVTPVDAAAVAVLVEAEKESFPGSPGDADEMLAAMAEIERGEFFSAAELLDSLQKFD